MQEITSEIFDKTVLASKKLTIVDFNADWCGPCRMQAPILEDLLSTSEDNYQIASVNIDSNPELAEKYSVSSIPCLVFFKDGEEQARFIGLQPKAKLEKTIEKILAA